MILFWVPETKQRTLEELEYVVSIVVDDHEDPLTGFPVRRSYTHPYALSVHQGAAVLFQETRLP